jgi:hypothetical protein
VHVRYATRNFLQQAFDCEPWDPPFPTISSLSPTNFGKLVRSLLERRRSGKQKIQAPSGNDCPEIREKFPI